MGVLGGSSVAKVAPEHPAAAAASESGEEASTSTKPAPQEELTQIKLKLASAEERAQAAEERAAAAEKRAAVIEKELKELKALQSAGDVKTHSQPAAALPTPSGTRQRSTSQPPLLVCCQSGVGFAHSLLPHLGEGWELVSAETPDEARVAAAKSIVILLTHGCLDAPEIVFTMRCVLQYSKRRVLIHAAESCVFDLVMPRTSSAAADVQPLYNKIAITLIQEYADFASAKVLADLEEQQQEEALAPAPAQPTEASHEHSDEELQKMQAELLQGAPKPLKQFGLAFTVFLSHRRATGQGPIGRIYQALKEDYCCFLDSEVKFKLHNLRVLVTACNYFLFYLSEGILDKSPFCLEELLSAIHTDRTIFIVRDLQYQLPTDIKAAVREVMRERIGEAHLIEHYGWALEDALARVEAAISQAWTTRITYQAEHFAPCMQRIRLRLGVPCESPLFPWLASKRHALQPVGQRAVDFAGLQPLTELKVHGDSTNDAQAVALVMGALSSSIQTVSLRGVALEGSSEARLADAIRTTKSVTALNMESINIQDWARIAHALKENESLTSISLEEDLTDLPVSGARHLAEALKENNRIKSIAVRSTISPVGFDYQEEAEEKYSYIFEALKANNSISNLMLKKEHLTMQSVHLTELLKNNQAITSVSLIDTRLGDKGAIDISGALKENKRIVELNLGKNQIAAQGIQAIADALKVNQGITSINLESNPLQRKGGAHLSEALKLNKTITSINLAQTELGSESMCEALKVNKTITYMDLNDNDFKEEDGLNIAEALKTNTTLAELRLRTRLPIKMLKGEDSNEMIRLSESRLNASGAAIVCKLVTSCTTAKTLILKCSGLTDEASVHLADGLKKNQSFTSSDLANNRIGVRGGRVIGEALKENKSLSTLILASNELGDEGMIRVAEGLKMNATLTKIDISRNNLSGKAMVHVGEAIKANKSVTDLCLSSNKFGAEGSMCVALGLKANESITSLHLSSTDLGAEGAAHISEAIQANARIKDLSLASNKLGAGGAMHIANALKTNKAVTSLNLGHNMLDHEGLLHVIEALKVNQTITSINLCKNKLGNKGCKSFQEGLKSNSSITSLDLSSNSIKEEGAADIAEMLKSNRTITKLDLSQNSLQVSGGTTIAEALQSNTALSALGLAYNDLCGINKRGEGKHSSDCISKLAEMLRTNTTLTSIKLGYNFLLSDGALHISEALRSNSSLKELDLQMNCLCDLIPDGSGEFNPNGLKKLLEALKINDSITVLDLSNNLVCGVFEGMDDPSSHTCEAVQELAETLAANHSITSINLSGNFLRADGVALVAKALKGNKVLKTLECAITALPSALRVNSNVVKTYTAIVQLAESLTVNKTITSIDLRENKYNFKDKACIWEALKANNLETEISWDDLAD
ncbi:hypothetical protein AB1Y20_006710 [Prymnesium parvum]|uniref:Uncharacterized protein n=1 Tax=Prymnesium parvum TaxID=97485 RepID=A0AB34J0G4_PRYPA